MKYPEINETTKRYWKDFNNDNLYRATTIKEVFSVALDVLSRMPEKMGQVCGPVTSGGIGSVEGNLENLNNQIRKLQEKGVVMFDQMPFEETFHRIIKDESLNQKYENILTDFYEPLFSLNRINTLYFVEGWKSSRGANWEHDKAKELSLSIVYL